MYPQQTLNLQERQIPDMEKKGMVREGRIRIKGERSGQKREESVLHGQRKTVALISSSSAS